MYGPSAIQALVNRIGWNKPLEDAFPFEISDENLTSQSGKHFQGFHNLVTVFNILNTQENESISEEDFNELLFDIRKQGVLQVISDVFDAIDLESTTETDKTELIVKKAAAFDTAIGLCVARSVLQSFMTTRRLNSAELNAKMSIANLKMEVDGYFNGHRNVSGLTGKYGKEIERIKNGFYPKKATVQGKAIW